MKQDRFNELGASATGHDLAQRIETDQAVKTFVAMKSQYTSER